MLNISSASSVFLGIEIWTKRKRSNEGDCRVEQAENWPDRKRYHDSASNYRFDSMFTASSSQTASTPNTSQTGEDSASGMNYSSSSYNGSTVAGAKRTSSEGTTHHTVGLTFRAFTPLCLVNTTSQESSHKDQQSSGRPHT